MTLLGLRHTIYVVIMAVLTSGNVSAYTWPYVNLCPQRGTFPMFPGCRIFCLCHRPGGAGRLLACPEGYRFNHEQERCTDDAKVCETNKQEDPPALLHKAQILVIKDMKSECETTCVSYCANRWELIICHPVWSHMLGIVECDPKGDGSHACSLLTDTCERNQSSLWETLNSFDSSDFGILPNESSDVANDTVTISPVLSSATTTPTSELTEPITECEEETTPLSSNVTSTNASEPGEDINDPCDMIGDWPGAECKDMGSWCLPDSETIVTCGTSKQIRQVRNCKNVFAKYNLEAACLPLVFGCAYWQLNPVPDSWVPGKSEHDADHQHEAFEAWFREHWCKTHGRRGVLCTPDGQSLAHCNENLTVDSVFHCASVVPKEVLLGCQFCDPGTAFCIYRPRAELADQCGVPGPDDDHDVACGFLPRKGRGLLEFGNAGVPDETTSNKGNTGTTNP